MTTNGTRADVWELGPEIPVNPALEFTLRYVRSFLETSYDVTVRKIVVEGARMALVYVDGLVDKPNIHESILAPLLTEAKKLKAARTKIKLAPDWLTENLFVSHNVRFVTTVQDVVLATLDGETVLLGDGWRKALSFDTRGWEKRAVEQPEAEVVLRGPREGFTEDVMSNISLIRRRLHHPALKTRGFVLGRLTRTRVIVMYVEGLARPDLVNEVISRVSRIDIGCVLDSGYIEEFIEDNPFSPFPQIVVTERPDRIASILLEGGAAIIVDGSPFVLAVPLTLAQVFQMPEDYYGRWAEGTVMRLIRFLSAGISLLLPAVYVALTTFHQELIPRPLAISIAVQREFVPYPAIVEALVMLVVFEILVEASIRLPRVMGQTIGIVGVLVLGEAAVRANLISAAMVIVISLTALSQFTLSHQITIPLRIVRMQFLVLASVLGLFGIFYCLILLLLHLCSLRSFGEPYLAPFAPFIEEDIGDALVRTPWWSQTTRPVSLAYTRARRLKPGQRPRRPAPPGRTLELESVVENTAKPTVSSEPSSRDAVAPKGRLRGFPRLLVRLFRTMGTLQKRSPFDRGPGPKRGNRR